MPIKNLTDNVAPAFQRIGELRKGGEGPIKTDRNGREYRSFGPELSFWRFTSDRPEVVAAFMATYGNEPVSINVFLPYTTVEDNFPTWREEWSSGTPDLPGSMLHRCDGETMVKWLGPDSRYYEEPRPCPHRGKDKPACKPVGRLSVIIPELWEAGFVGYVTMATHSLNDLLSITSVLRAVEQARNGHEMGLRGIPMVLRRQPEMISTPGDNGKRRVVQKHLVKIEPAADWVALQLAASKRLAYGDERLALSDGRAVNPGTGEVFGVPDAPEPPEFEEGDFTPEPPATGKQTTQTAAAGGHTNAAPACPKCGGAMWDNAAKKASGEMKPNAPDYKCKDKNCDGKYWPGQAQNGASASNSNGHSDGAPAPEYAAMSKVAKEHFGAQVKAGLTELMAIYGVTDSHALTPAQCVEITEKIGYLKQGAPVVANTDDIPW